MTSDVDDAKAELSPGKPMLIGLAIDVSASMTSAIQHGADEAMNRLEAVRESLKKLALRGRELALDRNGQPISLVKMFAFGFGFGNPLSVILGRSGPAVRDLLHIPGAPSSLLTLTEIADGWDGYEQHLLDLSVEMLGSTPMAEAIDAVESRFKKELIRTNYYDPPVLFLLSDGLPNRGTERQVLQRVAALRERGILIVSCYVSDHDSTRPRHLYGHAPAEWPAGARLLFDCASGIPEPSAFGDYLYENGWTMDSQSRFFAQINRSDILSEFLNMVIGPLEQKKAKGQSSPHPPAEVFISYAHEDAEFRERLDKHLSVLKRTNVVSTWHDRQIFSGQEWENQIDSHVESADVILLLVSENFLASTYCYDIEMKRALERHDQGRALVIPVILKPVDWKGAPFDKLQVLPTSGRPVTKWPSKAEGLTDVAKGIRRALQARNEK